MLYQWYKCVRLNCLPSLDCSPFWIMWVNPATANCEAIDSWVLQWIYMYTYIGIVFKINIGDEPTFYPRSILGHWNGYSSETGWFEFKAKIYWLILFWSHAIHKPTLLCMMLFRLLFVVTYIASDGLRLSHTGCYRRFTAHTMYWHIQLGRQNWTVVLSAPS